MAASDISLAELTRKAAKPDRWDDPMDPNMTDADVEGLMAVEPFCVMDEKAFPSSMPLREILRADTAIRSYQPGEIVVRRGDYGTSAYLVLGGEVEVILKPHLDPRLLGRAATEKKKGFVSRLAQLWSNNPEPEGWDEASLRVSDDFKNSVNSEDNSVFLQDFPRVISTTETAKLHEGQMFGEISALSRMPRTATVVASAQGTRLLEFSWQGLRDLMRYDVALKGQIDSNYRKYSLSSFLAKLPLFSHMEVNSPQFHALCNEAQLETFGDYGWSGEYKKLAAGGDPDTKATEPLVVKEGEYCNGIHLVRAGFCRVSQKYGGGERTLKYIGAGQVFGFDDVVRQRVNPEQDAVSLFTLRAMGYADLIFIPTATLVRYVPSHLLDADHAAVDPQGKKPSKKARARQGDERIHPPTKLMEFVAEQRFFNGTQSMVIDMDLCTRCDDCVRACASTHDGNPRFLRHGPMMDNLMVANACMHCVDPVCMIGCPTGAIHRSSHGGEVVINPASCIGCTICANNCPYDAIRMVEVRTKKGHFWVDEQQKPLLKATKCDLCIEQASGPACQNACPHDALTRSDLSQENSLIQWLKKR
ncbi:cyclic nucleotide-binding domain-containing protein [Akkermansiaceae bacterium]|nr:cyclic nucleotide-binding domain-containing protein [Akkermansiaceae bacterium]